MEEKELVTIPKAQYELMERGCEAFIKLAENKPETKIDLEALEILLSTEEEDEEEENLTPAPLNSYNNSDD